MSTEIDLSGVAWLSYRVYEWLWILCTFSLGFLGFSIGYSALVGVPLYAYEYALERRGQRDTDKPASKLNSVVISLLAAVGIMLLIYYLGVGLRYLID